MEDDLPFVDYYALLQVDPTCDAKLLEKAYRYFAQMYHPDHAETADSGRFTEVVQAYRILRDPEKRAEYDRLHAVRKRPRPSQDDDAPVLDEWTAIHDAEIHQRILLYLYKKRREHPQDAGVIGFYIQQHLGCSDENFQFHTWFLKSKGLIESNSQGELAINIAGVEHVIARSRSEMTEKLLLAPFEEPGD